MLLLCPEEAPLDEFTEELFLLEESDVLTEFVFVLALEGVTVWFLETDDPWLLLAEDERGCVCWTDLGVVVWRTVRVLLFVSTLFLVLDARIGVFAFVLVLVEFVCRELLFLEILFVLTGFEFLTLLFVRLSVPLFLVTDWLLLLDSVFRVVFSAVLVVFTSWLFRPLFDIIVFRRVGSKFVFFTIRPSSWCTRLPGR